MPPPVTPSPHRFLSSSTSSRQKPGAPPPSSFRIPQSSSTVSQQFSSVPRFSVPSGAKTQLVQPGSSSPLVSRIRHRSPLCPNEDDIDEYDNEPYSPPQLNESLEEEDVVLPSVEDVMADDFMLPPTKRRRLTPPPPQLPRQLSPAKPEEPSSEMLDAPVLISSSPSSLRSPSFSPTPSKPSNPQARTATVQPSSRPRFQFATLAVPQSSVTPSTADLAYPSRPSFILPTSPTNPHSDHDPSNLPIIFSPHRKGQRFVPGGMAATARDWIVGISGPPSRTERDARRYVSNYHVHDVREGGRGWSMVSSLNANSEQEGASIEYEKWIFVGSGISDAGGRYTATSNMPKPGLLIGIKEPIWDVDVPGEKWRVCIWWDVLDSG